MFSKLPRRVELYPKKFIGYNFGIAKKTAILVQPYI